MATGLLHRPTEDSSVTSLQLRTAALVVGVALMAVPSFAQGGGRRNGGEGGRRESVGRAQAREGGESRRRVQSQRRVEPRGRGASQVRVEPRGRVESQGRVEPYRGYGNRTRENRSLDNRSYRQPVVPATDHTANGHTATRRTVTGRTATRRTATGRTATRRTATGRTATARMSIGRTCFPTVTGRMAMVRAGA